MFKNTPLVIGMGLLMSPLACGQAVTIFDTSSGMPVAAFGAAEGEIVADDATLGDPGAIVSQLEVFLVTFSSGGLLTADVSAGLYADDGAGAPGALLWSENKVGLAFNSTNSSVIFESIDTIVGQNFFWSVTMDNVVADPGAVWGPRLATAANVAPVGTSTDPSFLYTDTGGGFVFTTTGSVDSTLGVRISGTPIPEPASAASLLFGFVAISMQRRRRTR